MSTPLQAANEKMKALLAERHAELDTIKAKLDEYRAIQDKATEALNAARESLDVEAYAEADKTISNAESAMRMYKERYEQIRRKDVISETESDEVMDSLLAYEDKLDADFKAAFYKRLDDLRKLADEYSDEICETENTIAGWQNHIHANYKTRGRTWYKKDDGTQTDRSETPISVHQFQYPGCAEYQLLKSFTRHIDERNHNAQ